MKQSILRFINCRVGILFAPALLSLAICSSCVNEDTVLPNVNKGEALVTLSLTVPANSSPTVSRSMSPSDEESVQSIKVLAFKGGYYHSTVAPENGTITQNEDKITFAIKLDEDDTYDLVVLANSESILSANSADIVSTKTKDEVLDALSMNLPDKWDTGPNYTLFPMSSNPEELKGITVGNGTSRSGIKLYRMVARVNVVLGEKDGVLAKSNFNLTSVHVYNRNATGLLRPAFNSDGYVLNAKSSPVNNPLEYDATYIQTEEVDGVDRGISCANEIYLFEANNTLGTLTPQTRPCLIIGGTFDTDDDPTYYRVDFSTDGKNYLDILRNHSYNVKILAVSRQGEEDPGKALESPSINMDVDVVPWDDNDILTVVTDGQYELGVNKKEFTFSPNAVSGEDSNSNMLIATTTYPGTWTVTVMNASTDSWLKVKHNDANDAYYSVGMSAGTTSAQEFYLQADINTGEPRTAYIYVTAGRLTQVIKVMQVKYTLTVSTLSDYAYTGGSQMLDITSSISTSSSSTDPVPWIAEFSTNGGTTWATIKPDWLTTFPASGEGSATAASYSAVAAAQPVSTNNAEDEKLKSATVKGTSGSPHDLSKGGTTVINTANCYIINAPGYYTLPLVYGNAIKDGETNSGAYNPSGTSTNFLKPFVNHADATITGPYIYSQATPANATLVWQDWPDMITNVSLDTDKKNLVFEVAQATIGQGNAIVAVRDADNTILWSWHIWVTPLVDAGTPTTDQIKNHDGYTYNFMRYNLGWCTGKTVKFGTAARSVQVRITQTGIDNGLSQEITVTQNIGTETTGDNSPYWQWGRKDPMPPSNGLGSTDKTIFGDYSYTKTEGQKTLGGAIQNPHAFYHSSSNWCLSGNYHNLWSATNTLTTVNDNVVVKTVYDPSPVGFTMPPSNAWTGFTTTGKETSDIAQFNVDPSTYDNGWTFKTGISDATVYYKATGYRGIDSGIDVSGYYWSAIPYSTEGYGYHLYFINSSVSPFSNSSRSCGFNVRCIKQMLIFIY